VGDAGRQFNGELKINPAIGLPFWEEVVRRLGRGSFVAERHCRLASLGRFMKGASDEAGA